MLRKIDKMHSMFGKTVGKKCQECDYLVSYRHHNRMVRKCEIYGDTRSEASDWAQSWDACGLIGKEWKGVPIIKTNRWKEPKEEEQIPGQISIFDIMEGEQ